MFLYETSSLHLTVFLNIFVDFLFGFSSFDTFFALKYQRASYVKNLNKWKSKIKDKKDNLFTATSFKLFT
jgi:hypothetical protein